MSREPRHSFVFRLIVEVALLQDRSTLHVSVATRRNAIAPALRIVGLILGGGALRLLGRGHAGLMLGGAASQQNARGD
jgi:hypothetical protein